MLGFSLPKLLVLVLIVLAVWYGFKWIGRLDKERRRSVRDGGAAGEPKKAVEDMVKCPVCDAYVPALGATKCDRADCPYTG